MTSDTNPTPDGIITFWMDAGPGAWFKARDSFDQTIAGRFAEAVEAASGGTYDAWQETPRGALALVLLLDQFNRNIYRGRADTWKCDPKAVAVAQKAIQNGFDMQLAEDLRRWFYMPHMHSEDRRVQQMSIELSQLTGDADHIKHAIHHAGIVKRFGRFPHRNAILGRISTPEEETYLAGDDAFKG